jgi:hypothetical protein
MTFDCPACGAAFTARAATGRPPKYCSRHCKDRFDHRHRTALRIERYANSLLRLARQHPALLSVDQTEHRAAELRQRAARLRLPIARVKAEAGTSPNLPDRVTGKDGKSYPASRSSSARGRT